MKKLLSIFIVLTFFASSVCCQKKSVLPALKVSDNGRYLVHEDGTPFFYLGDTAWELFHRLNREEAVKYLEDRAKKGFTVIQAVAIAELDGHKDPNSYGHLPVNDLDPTIPAVKDGPQNDYWDHVDFIVDKANELGVYIGFLPTWGRYWHDDPALFTKENAELYGEWIGKRYGNKGVIWILGGDRKVENDNQRAIIEAMANGLRKGDGGRNLITFHPRGGSGSSEYFHESTWLDFNMRQNGAMGHTYGHHSVWQMWSEKRNPINGPLMPWYEALNQPGAGQMQYGKKLMESRPCLTRVPENSILVTDRVATSVPGAGRYRFAATKDIEGTYAMIYVPAGRSFTVKMDAIKGTRVKAWWYNPRDGKASDAGSYTNKGNKTFISPDPGEALDWILVLDDESKKYPAPGTKDLKR